MKKEEFLKIHKMSIIVCIILIFLAINVLIFTEDLRAIKEVKNGTYILTSNSSSTITANENLNGYAYNPNESSYLEITNRDDITFFNIEIFYSEEFKLIYELSDEEQIAFIERMSSPFTNFIYFTKSGRIEITILPDNEMNIINFYYDYKTHTINALGNIYTLI
ncbi:MAG: hypothetical protein AB7S44_03110 [Spirochaetales bacterium]